MKNTRSIPLAMLFAFCIIMFSLTSYSQDLKALLNEQLKAAPKFDRDAAEKKALTELGLNKMPSEVPDGKELADLVGMEAEKLAALKFTAEMKAKVQQEAKAKFKAVQQGDEITVQLRQGAGFVDYKGKYKGTAGEKLLVGERQILKSDLQPDMLERLDAGKVAMAQGAYLSTNFTDPRKRYIAEQAEKLNKGYAEKKKVHDSFISAVDTEEKEYKAGLKDKVLDSVLSKYLEQKQTDIDKLPNDKDKLKAYDNLVAEIKTFLNAEGVTKTLESYASMKPVIADAIPALEKKESERLATEKRKADEKPIAEEKADAGKKEAQKKGQDDKEKALIKKSVTDEKTDIETKVQEKQMKKDVVVKRERETDWEKDDNLKGNVKERVKTYYDIKQKFGKDVMEETEKAVWKYNENGYRIEFSNYKGGSVHIYKYDGKGNALEMAEYNASGVLKEKSVIKYYDNGRASEEIHTGVLNYNHINKFDDNGNKIEHEYHVEGSGLISRDIYKYDENGNKCESISYDPKGIIKYKTIYKYDKNGKMTESTSYDKQDRVKEKSVYKYDNNGNKTEWAGYDEKNASKGNSVWRYDSNGKCIEIVDYAASGDLKFQHTAKYDEYGNMTELATFNKEETLLKIKKSAYVFY